MLNLKEAIKKSLRFLLFDNSCTSCHNTLDREGFICSKCLKNLKREAYLKNKENFFYVFIYEKAVRQIIADYKLRNRKDLAKDLAYLIQKTFFQFLEREKIDVVIPVPISDERMLERGFNQIEYLLELLSVNYKKIQRIKDTKHMYNLKDVKKRAKNVKNVFKNKLNLTNKNVLIVDDVVTSGATIRSICEELEKTNENINIKVFSIAMARHFINN